MRLLVFQHIACEHPGIFRKFLEEDRIGWDAVRLYEGEAIPKLKDYDALWVMGGPMDVWDVDEHPWLVPEKQAIRRWVKEIGRPFLGICLGHQLLADALGAPAARSARPRSAFSISTLRNGCAAIRSSPAFRHDRNACNGIRFASHSLPREQPCSPRLTRLRHPGHAHRGCRWSMQYHGAARTRHDRRVGPGTCVQCHER